MNIEHNKKDGEGNIDYSTKHNNEKHSDTDRRVTKIWVMYLLCRDEDTGDTWTESVRQFPATDSFAKNIKKKTKKPKKPKIKKSKKKVSKNEVEEW